jgi:16S rRNA C967 or C1407 C5-methylase (RsmB/RsmF family)
MARSVFNSVALLLPQHRAMDRRRTQMNLDDLLDDFRQMDTFEAWGLDLLFMSYRLYPAFEEALLKFRPSGITPVRIQDYLAMGFAARLTREHSRLLSQLVDHVAHEFGPHMKGLSNAFFRFVDRNADAWLTLYKQNPELLLTKELRERWHGHLDLQRQVGSKLLHRPEAGIEGFTTNAVLKRQSLQQWRTEGPFQAIQSASWEWVRVISNTGRPKRVLDACAAPGSKLIALITQLKLSEEPIVACDISPKRIERLKENLKNWGYKNVELRVHDWKSPLPDFHPDWVLADLPCTGLGTLHTRPDLVVEKSWLRLKSLQAEQAQILDTLKRISGARIFVSLCSVDPEEIHFISQKLGKDPDFQSWNSNQVSPNSEGVVGWIYG